jgi:hypothetical protein
MFGLLAERITAGEIQDVKGMLPQPMRELWLYQAAPHRRRPRGEHHGLQRPAGPC